MNCVSKNSLCDDQLPRCLKPTIQQSQNSAFKLVKLSFDSKSDQPEDFNAQIL